jgi:hypothetical protein
MSADGSLVVGRGGSTEAMVWDAANGKRSLRAMLLLDHALDVGGAQFGECRAISRDGRNLAGSGRASSSGPTQLWSLHLEPCCTPADMNCDFRVDIGDLAVFLSHFGSCHVDPGFWPRADIDRRGCVDLPDLAILLGAFGTICE